MSFDSNASSRVALGVEEVRALEVGLQVRVLDLDARDLRRSPRGRRRSTWASKSANEPRKVPAM